jgi:hypothetical protein
LIATPHGTLTKDSLPLFLRDENIPNLHLMRELPARKRHILEVAFQVLSLTDGTRDPVSCLIFAEITDYIPTERDDAFIIAFLPSVAVWS